MFKSLVLVFIVFLLCSPVAAQQLVRISVPYIDGATENDSTNPRISADGNCIVFQSNGELDACYGVNRSDYVFLYERSAGTATLSSLVDGRKQGFGTDKAAISGNCSHIAFNIYEIVGNPPVPSQVYWRENPGSSQNNGVSVLPVDTPVCRSLDAGAILEYQIREPGRISLSSEPGAIELAVTYNTSSLTGDSEPMTENCQPTNNGDETIECEITQSQLDSEGGVVRLTSVSNLNVPFTLSLDGEINEGYASISGGVKSMGYTRGFGVDFSYDGQKLAFETTGDNLSELDNNGFDDVYVHNTITGETGIVSLTPDGSSGDHHSGYPRMSADGESLVFTSSATNIIADPVSRDRSAYVHRLNTGTTELVSVNSAGESANQLVVFVDISADGRYVAFETASNNLVDLDQNGIFDDLDDVVHQIYVHDMQTGATEISSVDNNGSPGLFQHYRPVISGDGRFVAFLTASALVPEDSNEFTDVYVRDRVRGRTVLVSKADDGTLANESSHSLDISDDGLWLTFESSATNLTADDRNNVRDIFLVNLSLLPDLSAEDSDNGNIGSDNGEGGSETAGSSGGGGCTILPYRNRSPDFSILLLLAYLLIWYLYRKLTRKDRIYLKFNLTDYIIFVNNEVEKNCK